VLREAERLAANWACGCGNKQRSFFATREHLHHRAVNAIRTGGLLTTVAPPEITPARLVQASGRNAKTFFRSSGVAASNAGNRRPLQFTTRAGEIDFPEFTVPEGETPDSYLQS